MSNISVNITELKQLLEATPASHNIMLVGNHGIGKSEILTEHFKEFGMPVIALFLGQMADPGDLIGLPCKDEKTGKTDFMPPYWFPTDGKPIVLFLDELNRARPEILQTVMDLALNRKLAELWEEDELTAIQINEIIATTKSWGSIGGDLAEILQNSLKAKINWRNIRIPEHEKRKAVRLRNHCCTEFEKSRQEDSDHRARRHLVPGADRLCARA